MKVERIRYAGFIPDEFFEIGKNPYCGLNFSPKEDPVFVRKLFEIQSAGNGIIIYTDYENIRLTGIFPHDSDVAYYGFWETSNDLELNKELFQLLEADVLIAQRKTLIGPLNFNTFHSYRLRMEGVPSWGMFDREPVNPLYYPNLLLKLGFTIKGFFESRHVENKHVNDFYAHKKPFLERIANLPFEFVALTSETWSRYENSIYEFVDETFGANPAYKVISKTEFSLLYNEEFADKLCPYSSVLFVDKANGKIAALSFCQPNYASLNAKSPEPIFSRDFEKLERKILLIKTIGVHPNYRNQNLMSYLGAYAMLSFTKLYDEAIFCLMRSDNVSTNFTRGLPYDTAKYALFEKGS